MKRKLALYIGVLALSITGTVYAEEVATEPEIVTEEISVEEVVEPSTPIEEKITLETPQQTEEIQEEPLELEVFESEEILFTEIMEVSSTSSTSTEVATTSKDVSTSTPTEDTATFLIRNGTTVLFEGDIALATTSDSVQVADLEGDMHTIPSNSVLALLLKVDELSESFDVNKLNYYDSFGAFYLKCIQTPTDELCENWQYVLNNVSPWTGIDQTFVSPGDSIGIYFGNPYQILFSTSTYSIDTPFTASAQQYNYQDNTWGARTHVTLGATIPDPSNPWSPIEVITIPVNAQGESVFTIATSGEYMIGIQEDYYYPTYSITVSSSTATTTATSTTTGGSTGGSNKKSFDVPLAVSFIKALQGSSGSYGGAELYSDWVAIAFGAQGTSDSSLLNYLKSKSSIKSTLTDNERRVMALLALGKNPYNFEGINYIDAIIKDFDGTQFGEKSLVNDDIFALIVLSKTGYESNDNEIQKAIEFILKKQSSNGSWESSVDLTSAGIQALLQFENVTGVASAISKASTYLENQQQTDGGWSNVYATAWAMQAMTDLNESWTKNNNSPKEYLANQQKIDGGLLEDTTSSKDRIWATSYAIPAVLEMSWNDILKSVSRPTTDSKIVVGEGSSTTNATSTATTTAEIIPVVEEEVVEEIATSTLVALTQEFQEESFVQEKDTTIEPKSTSTDKTSIDQNQLNTPKRTSWFGKVFGYIAGFFAWIF